MDNYTKRLLDRYKGYLIIGVIIVIISLILDFFGVINIS